MTSVPLDDLVPGRTYAVHFADKQTRRLDDRPHTIVRTFERIEADTTRATGQALWVYFDGIPYDYGPHLTIEEIPERAPDDAVPALYEAVPGLGPPGVWRAELHGTNVVVSDGRTRQYRASAGTGGHVGPVLQVYYRPDLLPAEHMLDGQPTYGEPSWEPREHYRRAFGEVLARVLNGEEVEGLGGFEAVGTWSFAHADGRRVSINGPHIDANPPSCKWVEDERPAASYLREVLHEQLIVALLGPDTRADQAGVEA